MLMARSRRHILQFLSLALGAGITVLAVAEEGIFGPVELRGKERNDLIDTADQIHDQLLRWSLLYTEPGPVGLVRQIGHTLAPDPTDDYFDYEFYVIRDPSPNAFAMPNGRIYVHTGMLARLSDSSELAALLGHEITHVAGHHSIVQFRLKAGQMLDWIFTGGVVTLLTKLRFSRELEQEADDRSPEMLLESGLYDPHAVPELMELLNEDFEGVRPRVANIWTTHPDPVDRLARSLVRVADMPRRERDPDAFDAIMHPLRAMTVRDYIQDDFPYTAIAVAQGFIERYPEDLEFRLLLADAWKALGPRSEFAPDDFTNADKRKNLRRRMLRTRVERVERLMETPEGQAAYAANMAHARSLFEELLKMAPDYAQAQRGLGEVYEALGMPREAGRAYLQYIRQMPDATDRPVIMARLAAIREQLLQKENADDVE